MEPSRGPAQGFVGPVVNKPVYLDDGTIVAGASLQDAPGKRIHVERSTDNGRTWTKTPALSDPAGTKYKLIQPPSSYTRRSACSCWHAPTAADPTRG